MKEQKEIYTSKKRMDIMRFSMKYSFLISLTLVAAAISCASVKTVNLWKDEGYNQRLQKVLVISVSESDFMQKHFEDVFSERLASRGVEAVPANKVFSQPGEELDKAAIATKVRELGIKSVLVARAISKEETAQLLQEGGYVVPVSYYAGWYNFYSGASLLVPPAGSAYDTEFFTIVANIYDVGSEKLVWSSISKVKVEASRQGAINPFIDALMKQLERSKLF